ncbi:MAG: signal peptidase I [Clostridium sp.]|nr:signal peptidase I [Clostridium sp.]
MKVKKGIKIILNVLFYIILAFLIYASLSVLIYTKNEKQPEIFGYKFYVVLTGSMKPNIEPSDLIVTKKVDVNEICNGDVITFKVEGVDNVTTHRVKEIINSEQGIRFVTQGDANNIADLAPVREENIEGKVVKVVPKAGKMVDFIKNNLVAILSVIIAVFVLIIVLISILDALKNKKNKNKVFK